MANPPLLGSGMRKFEHPSIIIENRCSITLKPNAFLIISLILLLFASILALDNPCSIVFIIESQWLRRLSPNFSNGLSLLILATRLNSSNASSASSRVSAWNTSLTSSLSLWAQVSAVEPSMAHSSFSRW